MLSSVQRIEKSASNQCADVYCSNHMAKVSLLMQNEECVYVFAGFHVFFMENGPNERWVNVTNGFFLSSSFSCGGKIKNV